ncbi:hypothetical protein [Bacillus sp. SD075]|uniref:ATP-dependent DNA ligase n=1 Tax=Bacillus sp. SD075 TaxID=2781732 RepID=UPI0037C12052
MSRFQSNRASTPVTFATFDVLQHEGQSVTNLPLLDRKEILADLVREIPPCFRRSRRSLFRSRLRTGA